MTRKAAGRWWRAFGEQPGRVGVECIKNSSQAPQRERGHLAVLETGDRRLGAATHESELILRPTAPVASPADRFTEDCESALHLGFVHGCVEPLAIGADHLA